MSKEIILCLSDSEQDKKISEHLVKYSEVVGVSDYIKQLLYEDMLRKEMKKPIISKVPSYDDVFGRYMK